MPSLTINELMLAQKNKDFARLSEAIQLESGKSINFSEFLESAQLLENMMSTTGRYRGPKLNMAEALRAADVSILFPKVISDVLMRPKEPLMIGQTLLSKTIKVDNVKSVEFPSMGALRAFDIPDMGEYREQHLSFKEDLIEIKVNKAGLMFSISDDLIKDSMWDLLALYVESAGYAMLRHKEEKIFNEFQMNGHTVYDNNTTTPSMWTRGKAYNQTANYSVTFDDFIAAMGALVSHEYVPTDFVMHPLAWAVFATDPILRNVMYTASQIGQTIWTSKPDFDQQANIPWNVNYQVSPFVPFALNSVLTNGPASGLPATNISSVYVIDRNQGVVILQREEMGTEDFKDFNRDATKMKVYERYGVGSLNGGRSAAVINNIRLEQNYAPGLIVGTVVPA